MKYVDCEFIEMDELHVSVSFVFAAVLKYIKVYFIGIYQFFTEIVLIDKD